MTLFQDPNLLLTEAALPRPLSASELAIPLAIVDKLDTPKSKSNIG